MLTIVSEKSLSGYDVGWYVLRDGKVISGPYVWLWQAREYVARG
jgi:hypothetical protein